MSCKFCGTDYDNEPLLSLCAPYVTGEVRIEDGNLLTGWATGDETASDAKFINFCPVCGRRLEGEEGE